MKNVAFKAPEILFTELEQMLDKRKRFQKFKFLKNQKTPVIDIKIIKHMKLWCDFFVYVKFSKITKIFKNNIDRFYIIAINHFYKYPTLILSDILL